MFPGDGIEQSCLLRAEGIKKVGTFWIVQEKKGVPV